MLETTIDVPVKDLDSQESVGVTCGPTSAGTRSQPAIVNPTEGACRPRNQESLLEVTKRTCTSSIVQNIPGPPHGYRRPLAGRATGVDVGLESTRSDIIAREG